MSEDTTTFKITAKCFYKTDLFSSKANRGQYYLMEEQSWEVKIDNDEFPEGYVAFKYEKNGLFDLMHLSAEDATVVKIAADNTKPRTKAYYRDLECDHIVIQNAVKVVK
jgi:hypothetical protein